MGKVTGFMEYARKERPQRPPEERLKDFAPFQGVLPERSRRRQGGRCMDCGVPFCQAGIVLDGQRLGCPLHNLIPEWNDLLFSGNEEEALSRLLKTNCFPEFTGRVCPALCERACVCGVIGAPVTIRDNELSIIEYAFENGLMIPCPPQSRSGKHIAVVGSGPAGLAAAYYLNRRGHSVTVFERDLTPGGLLTYGIPAMKLPKYVIKRRVSMMEQEGVQFKTGRALQAETDAKALAEGFDLTIFCCGAQAPREMAVSKHGRRFLRPGLPSRHGGGAVGRRTGGMQRSGKGCGDCRSRRQRQRLPGYGTASGMPQRPSAHPQTCVLLW